MINVWIIYVTGSWCQSETVTNLIISGRFLAFLISIQSLRIPNYLRSNCKEYLDVKYGSTVLTKSCSLSLIIYHCLFRQPYTPAMAGVNLGRSRSLQDVSGSHQLQPSSSTLSSSVADVRVQLGTGNTDTARTHSTATVASEEEGLALLGEDAMGDLLE
jgi:hypothetical protein